MQEAFKKQAFDLLIEQNFDCLAVGVVDFSTNKYDCLEMVKYPHVIEESLNPILYFDLASVTKPLTMSLAFFLHEGDLDSKLKLLLNHEGGLPDWGLLSKKSWRNEVSSYKIEKSAPVYSDYSALRFMLEYEKQTQNSIHEIGKKIWDKELVFWKNLPETAVCPPTGFRKGRPIVGEVHDPNAYTIGEFCTHAGLFATINGLCKTLLNFNNECNLVEKMQEAMKKKNSGSLFVNGWDTTLPREHQRIKNRDASLAGKGCSEFTFGFLGFTGTSIWIDPLLQRGSVILTNGTKNYWYSRSGLNKLRRDLGESIWKMDL